MKTIISLINYTKIDKAKLYDILDILSSEDQNRVKSYSDDRRIGFLSARYLLKNIGVDISSIHYSFNGKPIINNGFISISYSESFVIVCYSNRKVGIDIERIRNVDDSVKKYITGHTCSNVEFFKKFTMIESYIKYFNLNLKSIKDIKSTLKYKYYYIDDYIICLSYQ